MVDRLSPTCPAHLSRRTRPLVLRADYIDGIRAAVFNNDLGNMRAAIERVVCETATDTGATCNR